MSDEAKAKRQEAMLEGYRKAYDTPAADRWIGKEGMKPPWPEGHKGHWWSGWPGAHCLRCGSGDPMENAFALGWCDFQYDDSGEPTDAPLVWDTPAHRAMVEALQWCPDDGPSPDVTFFVDSPKIVMHNPDADEGLPE